jgi:hypothetical protein
MLRIDGQVSCSQQNKEATMIHPDSLGATLDAINAAFFYQRPPSRAQKEAATRWLLERQFESGQHAGLFAPTGRDYKDGVRLFTGEKLKTLLATRNILGSEAARALTLFDLPSAEVQSALERLDQNVLQACYARSCVIGECAHSAIGLVRYLCVAALDDAERRLGTHVEIISQHRNGDGRWKRFPFYYTLLALSEMDLPAAVEELRYAAPACERLLRRSPKDDVFSQRRRAILQKVLARC